MNTFGQGPLRRTTCAVLGCLLLLAGAGCSTIKVHMGLRVSLAKIPVNAIEASLGSVPAIAPGEKTGLVVTLAGSNGQTLVTEGAGKGKVLWRDLAVAADVISVDKKCNVTLPRDPRVSEGKTGHITVIVPSQPGLRADLDVPLRYDYPFTSRFFGAGGTSGFNGTDGTNGSDGLAGSMDPDHPSPGGNGSSGTDGTNGSEGGDGGDGPPVQVMITLKPGDPALLQAGVTAPGHRERFYLINPNGGSFSVTSTGGAGGSGGRGGRGGRGGSGGIGSPTGSSGSDGHDGQSGSNGRDGNGGSITVTYDPQVKPFLSVIRLSNPGGPKPVFNEAHVDPLW